MARGGERTDLVNECELHAQLVSYCGCALGTARIRADNDSLLVVGDVALNVALQKRASVEVVDGDIKVALVLGVVQVHGDDVIRAGAGKQVGHQRTCLRDPLLVSGTRLEGIDLRGIRSRAGRILGDSVRGNRLEGFGGVTPRESVPRAPLYGTAIVFFDLGLGEALLEVVDAVHQSESFRFARTWGWGSAFKSVAIVGSVSYG